MNANNLKSEKTPRDLTKSDWRKLQRIIEGMPLKEVPESSLYESIQRDRRNRCTPVVG